MQWSPEVLNSFWKRWYFPANATLYVVGNLGGSVEETRQLIEQTFGRVPPGVHPTHDSGLHGNGNGNSTVASSGAMKMRHEVAYLWMSRITFSSNVFHQVFPLCLLRNGGNCQ